MLKIQSYILITLFVGTVFTERVLAQPDSVKEAKEPYKEKSLFTLGLGYQRGFIFAHSQAVQNTKGANPAGMELWLGWQRNDAAAWDLCNCYPRKGLLLNYYNYDNTVLGHGFSAAYFLEPKYRLGKNLFFSFKGVSGFSYLTNPFDSLRNPTNQSYSTHLSAYLMVGLGFWVPVNRQWWVNASVNYQHVSNGGLRQPNKGINWPTAGLAVHYQKETRPFYSGLRTKEKFWKNNPWHWEAALFGIARRALDDNGNSRRLPLTGIALQAGKQVGRINALTVGTEIYRDEELRVQLKRDAVDASPVKAGLLAGHAFLLGRFVFSQRLGVYIFDQTPYYDRLYHRWGIDYKISRRIGAGINLQAHKQVADFVDFRLLYTLRK